MSEVEAFAIKLCSDLTKVAELSNPDTAVGRATRNYARVTKEYVNAALEEFLEEKEK